MNIFFGYTTCGSNQQIAKAVYAEALRKRLLVLSSVPLPCGSAGRFLPVGLQHFVCGADRKCCDKIDL